MRRIAVAQWRQESNTFNRRPSTVADYERFGLTADPAAIAACYSEVDELGGFFRVLRSQRRTTIVPLLRAVAWSGGALTADAFDTLLQQLLDGLRHALPLDGVLLSLHGATAADGTPDVAGAVLAAVREIVGPRVALAACFDLHANVTAQTLHAADLTVGYRTNPHLDLVETGERTAELLLRRLNGEVRPVTALRKLPVLIGAEQQSTFDGPLALVAAACRAAEQAGALSASFYPVQPWLDVPGLASAVTVTTHDDPALADRLADDLADLLWDQRDACSDERLSPAAIAARVAAAERWPVVISDGADSTNSGAPGDSTVLLRAFLAASTPGPILLSLVDPLAAAACSRAGVGAELTVPVGGKRHADTGPPITVTGRVRAISDGRYRISGHGGTNVPVDCGLSAWLEVGPLHLVLTSHVFVGSHPRVYQSLGLDPTRARAVIAKSPYGFRHDYGPFAAEILLAECPGAATGNYPTLRYEHVGHALHPLTPLPDRHTPEMEALAIRPSVV